MLSRVVEMCNGEYSEVVNPLGFYFLKKFSQVLWCLRSRDHWALGPTPSPRIQMHSYTCLLYTSDAADE